MKRTRLPSRHTPQEGVQKDGSPRLGSCCYGRTSTPCTNAPARRRRATDGEVHMVFPRSGPGRPIRALLAGRGDMEFAIANVSEVCCQVESKPQALRSCGGCAACRGTAAPTWWTSRQELPSGSRAHPLPGCAFLTAGTGNTPGCCRPRRASGCLERPWTCWRRPPRQSDGSDRTVCPGGRPPLRGSAGGSSLVACLLPLGQSGAMLPLRRSGVNLHQGRRQSLQPRLLWRPFVSTRLFWHQFVSLLYYIPALWPLTHARMPGELVYEGKLRWFEHVTNRTMAGFSPVTSSDTNIPIVPGAVVYRWVLLGVWREARRVMTGFSSVTVSDTDIPNVPGAVVYRWVLLRVWRGFHLSCFGHRHPHRAWGGGMQVGIPEGMAGSAPGHGVFFPNLHCGAGMPDNSLPKGDLRWLEDGTCYP